MNINCQNSAYVGRTHLNPADANYKILQGEIDVLTLNLDMASNMLKNDIIASNLDNYNYTTSKFNELWDVNPNNNNGIIKYKEYLTYDDIYLTYKDVNHTYLINCNIDGEIRFSTFYSFSSTNDPVNDYSVKIDSFGKLYVYHKYNILQPTFTAGFYDIEGEIFGMKNFGIATDTTLAGVAIFQQVAETQIAAAQILVINLQEQVDILIADLNTMSMILNTEMYTLGSATSIESLSFQFEEIAQRISLNYTANITLATVATVGIGGAVPLILASASDYMNREYYKNMVKNYSNADLEITEEDRRRLYSCNDDAYYTNTSNYYYYTGELTRQQGFISSNILSTQTIPEIYGYKIGLGIDPSTSIFPLDVIGNINADYYYRAGVKQFVGTETQHSNLTFKQGYINSNVLSRQTIPSISTNDIGIGTLSRIGIYTDRIENLIDLVQTKGMFIKDILTYTPYLGLITSGTYGSGIYYDYMIQKKNK